LYYGWKIVFVAFISLFISVGFLFYSYGVFFLALEQEFGSSRLGISIGLAFMNLAMGIVARFIGKAVDRYSIRSIMITGTCLMAVGFLLAAQINALWQFYVILGTLLGVGAAFIGMIPSQTLVSNWFIRRRGTALGIATMGVSMSGMIMAPVSTWLIHAIGWRYTFIVYGLLAVGIVAPLVYAVVVNRPEQKGLYPDGEASPSALPPGGLVASASAFESDDQRAADTLHHHEWTVKQALMNVNFWAITLTISMCMHCIGAVLTHTIPLAGDLGFTGTQGAMIVSLSAGVGVIGKVLFGWIADQMDTRIAVWLSIAFQFAGVALLINADTYAQLQLAAVLFGFGMGGVVPLWGSLIGEVFGRENFGNIMGIMTPMMLPIQVAGVPLAGYISDHTGSYSLAFEIFLGVYTLAAVVLLMLQKKDVDQRMKRRMHLEKSA